MAGDTAQRGKLAILVGGGPAPGINSVIAAATLRAQGEGIEVLGRAGRRGRRSLQDL